MHYCIFSEYRGSFREGVDAAAITCCLLVKHGELRSVIRGLCQFIRSVCDRNHHPFSHCVGIIHGGKFLWPRWGWSIGVLLFRGQDCTAKLIPKPRERIASNPSAEGNHVGAIAVFKLLQFLRIFVVIHLITLSLFCILRPGVLPSGSRTMLRASCRVPARSEE